MKSIELYENRMFDIVFEDNRELFTINDQKTAEAIKRMIKSLQSEAIKMKSETQSEKSTLFNL